MTRSSTNDRHTARSRVGAKTHSWRRTTCSNKRLATVWAAVLVLVLSACTTASAPEPAGQGEQRSDQLAFDVSQSHEDESAPGEQHESSTSHEQDEPQGTGGVDPFGGTVPPCTVPDLEDHFGVTTDVSAWETYSDSENGLRIRYPPGWVIDDESFDRSATDELSAMQSITFSERESAGDFTWRINVMEPGHEWSVAQALPNVPGDRHVRSEEVVVDGVAGDRHIAFTCAGDRLRVDTVMLEHEGRQFVIIGGSDTSFEQFFRSLEMDP